MEGYETVRNPVLVRLAIGRGDLEAVRRLLPVEMPPPTKKWWRLTTIAARLDALIALGELGVVAQEAARFIEPGTYLEPFGLRALGYATGDRARVGLAAARLDGLGLDWHAAQTRQMLGRIHHAGGGGD